MQMDQIAAAEDGQASGAQWCALHTRHQHESTVETLLAQKGLEVFHPTYVTTRRWKDRNKKLSLPLFPGYVFLNYEPEHRIEVLSTPGVCAILSVAGSPAIIPVTEIDAIRLATQSGAPIEPHPFLKVGDPVRVKFGPLTGTEGYLLRTKDADRLILSIQMLGRSASVEVSGLDVEPAPRDRASTLLQ